MIVSRLHISTALGLAAAVWALMLWVSGTPITPQHFAPYGTVVAVLVVVGLLLEHVLWHWGWLQGWFFDRPDLRGTWRISLQSDWIDPQTNQPKSEIICYACFTQTLSKLQMHLMTSESESWFIAYGMVPTPGESGYCVVAVYSNKPLLSLRQGRSKMHFGALKLETHGVSKSKPTDLEAEYWTDRKTTGVMHFSQRQSGRQTRYADAKKAFND